MSQEGNRAVRRFTITAAIVSLCLSSLVFAAKQGPAWNADEQVIVDQIKGLRALSDEVRAQSTRDLALRITHFPASPNKLRLAFALANLSTEGDFGHEILQTVATTLAGALRENPIADVARKDNPNIKVPAEPYVEMAELTRYEHVDAPGMSDVPQFREALAKLQADDESRQRADFTLNDLAGKSWTLRDLRGKVVLVNFWATWCPPCRKEIPDLIALYQQFQNQGLVILGISDESAEKVGPFAAAKKVNYPVLLDPDSKIHKMYMVNGIPKSFIYNREGKLVTESIDMRTRQQFLQMLAEAGLQ